MLEVVPTILVERKAEASDKSASEKERLCCRVLEYH